MISRRTILSGLVGTTLVPAGLQRPAQANAVPKVFRVGYQKSSATFAVAKEQRVFERRLQKLGVEEVRWVEFQFGPPLLEALGTGSVDIGSVGDTPPIFAQVAKAKLVYIAGSTTVASGIVVPSSSAIRSPADLKGKKVAIAKGSSSHNLTVRALAKHGLSFKDIEPVYLAPADAVAAFASSRVDAWTIWDPYFAIAETKHGGRAIATTDDEGLGGYSYYLAGRDLAEKHPAVIQAALDGVHEASDWINSHTSEVVDIHAQVTGVDKESLTRAYSRYKLTLLPFDEKLIASQQQIADTFFELGIVPSKIDVRQIAWSAKAS
jgi:sulfonate transport system substrate-binding protein